MRRVAAKLLRGQPIKAFTLGGSVTFGHGVPDAQLQSYPARLFQFVEANYPNRWVGRWVGGWCSWEQLSRLCLLQHPLQGGR